MKEKNNQNKTNKLHNLKDDVFTEFSYTLKFDGCFLDNIIVTNIGFIASCLLNEWPNDKFKKLIVAIDIKSTDTFIFTFGCITKNNEQRKIIWNGKKQIVEVEVYDDEYYNKECKKMYLYDVIEEEPNITFLINCNRIYESIENLNNNKPINNDECSKFTWFAD